MRTQTHINKNALQRRFFAVLKQRGLTQYRSDIVIECTNGLQTSITGLTDVQLGYLCADIETGAYDWVKTGTKQPPAAQNSAAETRNKLRRTIISHFIEMGAVTDDGRADMRFIYGFVKKHWKNQFNSLTAAELTKIIAVLKQTWLPHFYKHKAIDGNYTIKNGDYAGV